MIFNAEEGSFFEGPERSFLENLREIQEENLCGYMNVSLRE
jgi:hypothetical protein